MYSKQQASLLRKNFWTRFGQYMRPVKNSEGGSINWLNYKTGIKHIYFRMDANTDHARIAIELRHPEVSEQKKVYDQFVELKSIMAGTLNEEWDWKFNHRDEDGQNISSISTTLYDVNIFQQEDWPSIISFLKPRIIALDEFWNMVKEGFAI